MKKYLIFSCGLLVLSIVAMIWFPPQVGIDFAGGSIIELSTTIEPGELETIMGESIDVSATAMRTGADTVQVRTTELSLEQHSLFTEAVRNVDPNVDEERFDLIGPSLSRELIKNAIIAVILGAVGILLYLAYMFRAQSKVVSSWVFGVVTVVVLSHDLLIASGAYAIYASITGASLDMLFVTALLAILGYSVNDTIVVSNRIVSDMRMTDLSFPELVRLSVRRSATRSVNTSATTLLVLLALLLFGGEATRPFVFTLVIGVIAGTYSSLFVAPPLLVLWQQWKTQE